MDLGNAIKTLRKQKKITQKQLAELSEISTNALCSIETGQSFPSKATISRICASLNIPESYLLLFSISEDDIPEDKKIYFRNFGEPLKKIFYRYITLNFSYIKLLNTIFSHSIVQFIFSGLQCRLFYMLFKSTFYI